MNNIEIFDKINGIKVSGEYSLINKRKRINVEKKRIYYNLSIKKAVDRALFISSIIFKIFFLLI